MVNAEAAMALYDIARALFTHDNQALADELGCSLRLLIDWKKGRKVPPDLVLRYLKLKHEVESRPFCWRDFRFVDERLVFPFGGALHYNELHLLTSYRRAHRLAEQQAELIERLMMERDFYKRNCHQQAKFGIVINSLFGGYYGRNDTDDTH